MEIVEHTAIRSHLAVDGNDRFMMLGYLVFAVVALGAVYFASGGPGVTGPELAIAAVFP
jgi:hypothetical protein